VNALVNAAVRIMALPQMAYVAFSRCKPFLEVLGCGAPEVIPDALALSFAHAFQDPESGRRAKIGVESWMRKRGTGRVTRHLTH